MRLVGFERDGATRVGVQHGDGVLELTDVAGFYAEPRRWVELARGPSTTLRRGAGPPRPLVAPTARILCVGQNYSEHIAETGSTRPPAPNIFSRFVSTAIPDGHPVPVPAGEPGLDWEVELAAVIGTRVYRADEAEAAESVLGYTVVNDITARARQHTTSQWALGKNADATLPIGPCLVTADAIDATDLALCTRVNGTTMQSGRTSQMIFSVPEIISYVSQTFTLLPGDVICTGTPGGVGWRRDPRVLLEPGDLLETEIEGVGCLRNPVVAAEPPTRERRGAEVDAASRH